VSLERINPDGLHRTPGYHHVTISTAPRYAHLSGQSPVDEDGVVVGTDDLVAQVNQVAHNIAVAPADAVPYQRMRVAMAWLLALPGAPLMYYGDEYGQWGGEGGLRQNLTQSPFGLSPSKPFFHGFERDGLRHAQAERQHETFHFVY